MPRGISSRSSTAPLSRVDAADVALVAFPGAVPQLAVDPGHAGDEAVGLDGAQDGAGLGIDLVDLAIAVLPHPQAALGPGEARVAAVAGRRDRRHHVAGGGIDLVDARFGDLVEVRAVEGGAGVAGAVERARELAALGIEGDQLGAGGGPDAAAVVGDAVDAGRRRRRGRTRARSRPRAPVLAASSCLSCLVRSSSGSLRRASERRRETNLPERQRSGE